MEAETAVLVRQQRIPLTPRTCARCGRAFQGWGRQRFCSPTCRRTWDYHEHAETRRANRRERYRREKERRGGGSE